MRLRDSIAACLLVASLATGQAAAEGGDERRGRSARRRTRTSSPTSPTSSWRSCPRTSGCFTSRLATTTKPCVPALRSSALNLRGGRELRIAFTPMFGGVAGDLDGLVPALRLTLAWWKLDLSSESEIVVSFGDSASSFFYNWSELGVSPRALAALRRGAPAHARRPDAARPSSAACSSSGTIPLRRRSPSTNSTSAGRRRPGCSRRASPSQLIAVGPSAAEKARSRQQRDLTA